MSTKKPTMKAISEKLGISINAVSLAINNRRGISQSMRNQILRTADDMGYFELKPKYLRNYSRNNLCLLAQNEHFNDAHFYSNIVRGMQEEAKKNYYDLIISFYDNWNFQIPNCIKNKKVSGILSLGKISNEFLQIISSYNIPVVLVDHVDLNLSIDSIVVNNKSGTYKACKFMFEHNIFDIGFFGDIYYSFSIKERFSGFKEAMLEHLNGNYGHMINFILERSIIDELEDSIIQKDISKIIDKLKNIKVMPKAFICSNDNAAIQLINALDLLGYCVPQDVSVIGFDNIGLCKIIRPNLTTINIDKQLMGRKAVKKLIFRINNKNQPVEQIIMDIELVDRDSVKKSEK